MSTPFKEMFQELRNRGISARKFQTWLRMKDLTDSLEQDGLQLIGLKEWLNQAPEIFLQYQEKPDHRVNLRELQEWLNQTIVNSIEKMPLTEKPLPPELPSITPLPTEEKPSEIPQPPPESRIETQEEENWDQLMKELEHFEEEIEKQENASSSEEKESKKKELKVKESPDFSYYLKRKNDIQGPYHFTRVLRYIREGRLPQGVQFSLEQEVWRDISLFPHKDGEFVEIQLTDVPSFEATPESNLKTPEQAQTSKTKRLQKKSPASSVELTSSKTEKSENPISEEFWLRFKGDIQGPYHYTRVLRYIREGRLPYGVEFSTDQQHWEDLEFFPYSLEEETASGAVRMDLEQTISHKKHETGILNVDDGDYHGEMEDGLPHGHGKISYPDNSSYVGGFRAGKFSGRGLFSFPDGGSYEGDWQDGNMHGLGKMIDSNGNIYNGRWVHGEQTGLGALTNKEGASYVGEFKQGKFHGRGSYTWPTGQTYVGEFQEGEFHGEGTLTITTLFGKKTQAGLWENGDYLGPTKEFAEATKTYKREARLGNKLAQKRLKELGIKWNY